VDSSSGGVDRGRAGSMAVGWGCGVGRTALCRACRLLPADQPVAAYCLLPGAIRSLSVARWCRPCL
jgi:hypothetical protein